MKKKINGQFRRSCRIRNIGRINTNNIGKSNIYVILVKKYNPKFVEIWHWPCLPQDTDIVLIDSRCSLSNIAGSSVIASAVTESPSTHVMTMGRRAEVGSGSAAVVTYVHDRVRRRRRSPRHRRNVAGRRLVAAAAPAQHGRRRFSGPRASGRCGVVFESSGYNIFGSGLFAITGVDVSAVMRNRYIVFIILWRQSA